MTTNRAPNPTFTSVAATMKQTADRVIAAGLLVASLLIAAVGFAAVAAAKGQEGGIVCTGTQMAAGTCQPMAVQATPIGSVPLGCQPSSLDTIACGRRGYHVDAAAAAQSQGLATPGGKH